jgi:hypothetical protein
MTHDVEVHRAAEDLSDTIRVVGLSPHVLTGEAYGAVTEALHLEVAEAEGDGPWAKPSLRVASIIRRVCCHHARAAWAMLALSCGARKLLEKLPGVIPTMRRKWRWSWLSS